MSSSNPSKEYEVGDVPKECMVLESFVGKEYLITLGDARTLKGVVVAIDQEQNILIDSGYIETIHFKTMDKVISKRYPIGVCVQRKHIQSISPA